MKNLKENEIVSLRKRLYKVSFADWNNGRDKGKRAFLKLLTKKELNDIVLKGGLKK